MRAAVIVTCLCFASLAHAQPGLTPPSLTPSLEASPPQPLRRPKDRGTAILASLGGTVAPLLIMMSIGGSTEPEKPIVLFGVAAVLLPSAGHWYAGKFFTTGMGIRLAGGLVATAGIAALAGDDDGTVSAAPALLGLAAVGVGVVWDLATAPSAVDAWNRKHATVTAAPMKVGSGYGVGLAGGF
ncbi:MAG TPA: hypothetical protein VIV11_29760 [Kofleriaceae bacterium]